MYKWGWDIRTDLLAGNFKQWGVDRIIRDIGISDKCTDEGGFIHCLSFVHGLDTLEDDDEDEEPLDEQTYDVGDRTYRMTGAHYGLGFDLQQGGQSYVRKSRCLTYMTSSHNCNGP